jgi:transcriptional regulator with XRE-family HTH domain
METYGLISGIRYPFVADLDYQAIGRRIAARRTLLDMTQQQLADRARISQRTIALLERGRRTGLRVATLTEIARALDVTREYLLTGEEEGN